MDNTSKIERLLNGSDDEMVDEINASVMRLNMALGIARDKNIEVEFTGEELTSKKGKAYAGFKIKILKILNP